jgi:hypothetical protein
VTFTALTNVINQLLNSEQDSTVTIQAAKSVDTKDHAALTAYIVEALSECSVLTNCLPSDIRLRDRPAFRWCLPCRKEGRRDSLFES